MLDGLLFELVRLVAALAFSMEVSAQQLSRPETCYLREMQGKVIGYMEERDYHKYSAYGVKVDLLSHKLNMSLTREGMLVKHIEGEGKFAAEYEPPKVHH